MFYFHFLGGMFMAAVGACFGVGMLWLAVLFGSIYIGAAVAISGLTAAFTLSIFMLKRAEHYV